LNVAILVVSVCTISNTEWPSARKIATKRHRIIVLHDHEKKHRLPAGRYVSGINL